MPSLRKRLPGAEERADASAARPAPENRPQATKPDRDAVRWEVQPDGGKPAWDMDVSVFASGDPEEGISARPALVREIAPIVRLLSRGKGPRWGVERRHSLKLLWAFLDHVEGRGAGEASSVSQIDGSAGQMLKTWLLQDRKHRASYARKQMGMAQGLISLARRRLGVENWDLIWPTVEDSREVLHKDVDPLILKPLYSVLKAHHGRAGAAIREGAELLRAGVDPRAVGDGRCKASWSEAANVAVVAREYLERALVDPRTLMADMATRFGDPENHRLPVLAPSALRAYDCRPFDAVRWFVPTREDAACAFSLVLLHTGWNPDTVFNIDVSSDQAWFDARLGVDGDAATGTVAIYGHKGKTGREQIAFSLVRPHAHPFQVIRSMIERTEPLRAALRAQLAALEAQERAGAADRREAASIRALIKSPWLYFTRSRGPGSGANGRIGVLNSVRSALLQPFKRFARKALRAVYRARKDTVTRKRHRPLLTLTPSDLRDGFAAFVYENSLYNILLLKRALNHRHVGATRAYVRQRRQMAHRFREYAQLQEYLFEELRDFRRIDPTILFLRVRFLEVTPEQRDRLARHRQLTRMGMGCLTPEDPPRDIAPDHAGGPCPVQRCTVCSRGVVFEESLGGLAVRMAELRWIRGRTAHERFEGSSFQMEWFSIDWMVSNLYPHKLPEFEDAVAAHLSAIKAGAVYVFEQAPPSFFEAASG